MVKYEVKNGSKDNLKNNPKDKLKNKRIKRN